MSDSIEFNGAAIGDEGRLLLPHVEALGSRTEPMLWATFADIDDSSRNWVYRIRVAVSVKRNTQWKVLQAVGALRAALAGTKADLVWKTGSVARITWSDARLDAIRPIRVEERARAGFDANLVLEFTSAADPT
jgi:hypothetical protein